MPVSNRRTPSEVLSENEDGEELVFAAPPKKKQR
jgi:hypothetical protein